MVLEVTVRQSFANENRHPEGVVLFHPLLHMTVGGQYLGLVPASREAYPPVRVP